MKKSGLLKIGFIALFLSPLLIGAGQVGGGGGCGGGSVTNNSNNNTDVEGTDTPAIEVIGSDEVTALSTGDYAASCTDTSCENLSWEVTRADVSALSTLGITKPDNLGFNQVDPRGIMMRFKPPLEEGGRTFKIRACNEAGVCGEKTVTVATETDIDFGNCQYDAIGSLVSGKTDIKVSSVWVTCKNQDCFKDEDGNPYLAGTLLWTVCGTNFEPNCANYAYTLTKIDVCGFESPAKTNGCPDTTNLPTIVGKGGAKDTFGDESDTEGMSLNPTVFVSLATMQEEGMELGINFVKQITGGALDLSETGMDGWDWSSADNPLATLTLRELADALHAVVMLGQHILEMGYNFFVAGLWVNTAGTAWDDPNFLYECLADGNGFNKMKDISGMGRLEIDSAKIETDGGARYYLSEGASYNKPVNIAYASTSHTFYLKFNEKLDTDTVNTENISITNSNNSTSVSINPSYTEGTNNDGDTIGVVYFTVSGTYLAPGQTYYLKVMAKGDTSYGVRGNHREDLKDNVWYWFKVN